MGSRLALKIPITQNEKRRHASAAFSAFPGIVHEMPGPGVKKERDPMTCVVESLSRRNVMWSVIASACQTVDYSARQVTARLSHLFACCRGKGPGLHIVDRIRPLLSPHAPQ